MMEKSLLAFNKQYIEIYNDILELAFKNRDNEIIKAIPYRLKVSEMNYDKANPSKSKMIFKDAAGVSYSTFAVPDSYTNIGDVCIIPFALKTYYGYKPPRELSQTSIGYYIAEGTNLDIVDLGRVDEFISENDPNLIKFTKLFKDGNDKAYIYIKGDIENLPNDLKLKLKEALNG